MSVAQSCVASVVTGVGYPQNWATFKLLEHVHFYSFLQTTFIYGKGLYIQIHYVCGVNAEITHTSTQTSDITTDLHATQTLEMCVGAELAKKFNAILILN